MLQKGVVPGNATPVNVDDLSYSYTNLSNKLVKVIDNSNAGTANGKLGDFNDGVNGTNDDYVYDDNGNLVKDLNKNVKDLVGQTANRGISYNFLDKPEEIRISGKGVIKIVYDADGNKLQKIFTPEGGGTATTTTYINEFVYKADVLQYINFEEGRLRVVQAVNDNNGYDQLAIDGSMDLPGSKRGTYDFFVRDYQGNVRMILTEETHTGSNACTMEDFRAQNEEPVFGQVDANGNPNGDNEVINTRVKKDNAPNWSDPSIGDNISQLTSQKYMVGPNTLLKVMAGDQLSASTIYYYENPVTNQATGNNLLNSILAALTGVISGSSAVDQLSKDAASNITSQFNGNIPFSDATSPDAEDDQSNIPKAYLTLLFFDERFNFVEEGSVALRVQNEGSHTYPLVFTNIKAPKNGYAFVYVSNESEEPVYFDNLQVSHNRGRIVEENHYYAYGLKIAGISSKKLPDVNEGGIKNNNLYNDKELWDDADLDWYDYGFRNYDPQIGRFPQLDPLTFEYPELTNYQYASCEPIANIDIDGLESGSAVAFSWDFTKAASSMTFIAPKVATTAVANGAKIGGQIAANILLNAANVSSKIANSESSTVTQHLQQVEKINELNNSPPTEMRLKRLKGEVLEQINEEQNIDRLVKNGLWDRNLTQDEAQKNLINFSIGLTIPTLYLRPLNFASQTSSRILSWGKNAKGHLIKHADVLGYGGKTSQQLQKMVPQLRSAANQLYNNLNPALTRIGAWPGQTSNVLMHITNNGKMLVTKLNGEFVTVINKTSNAHYVKAIPFK